MWLKQSTSIFIKVAVVATLANCQDPVTLDENSAEPVTIPLDSPLILKCNLTRSDQNRKWLSWYFNNDGPSPAKELEKVTNDTEDLDKTIFRVTSNAKAEHSGWYFCNVTVDIPKLKTIPSRGRKVVVSTTVEQTTHSSTPIVTSTQVPVSPPEGCQGMACKHWAILGVFAVVLTVLPVALFVLRKISHRSTGDDPIYANTRPLTHKEPSPRPRMQLHSPKMASSSQNFQDLTEGRYEDGKRRNKQRKDTVQVSLR